MIEDAEITNLILFFSTFYFLFRFKSQCGLHYCNFYY